MAEGLGANLMSRGFEVSYLRLDHWIEIPGVPRRPSRNRERLQMMNVDASPLANVEGYNAHYTWADDRRLRCADLFIFTLPSYLAEPVGKLFARSLHDKIILNVSDRFMGTYAMCAAARAVWPAFQPRLAIALSSPPLLSYQRERHLPTRIYYMKPLVMMGCFPQHRRQEACQLLEFLLGICKENIRIRHSVLELAFENINSVLHAVQDLRNLTEGLYGTRHRSALYAPATYDGSMIARVNAVVRERDEIAHAYCVTSFRSLAQFDASTFRLEAASPTSLPGSPIYRHEHPLLRSLPCPLWYTAHGYEDVGWSMVPLESFGDAVGISHPEISALIDDWNRLSGVEYRRVGRTIHSLGLVDHRAPSMPLVSSALCWQFGVL